MKKLGLLVLILGFGLILFSGSIFQISAAVYPPQNLIIPPEALSDTGTTLIWDKPASYADVVGYNVYQDGKRIGSTLKLFYNVNGLTPATRYNFVISAIAKNGDESPQSNIINITTQTAGPILDVTKAPYNAVGNDSTLNTTNIQQAIDACPDGGTVWIPAGGTFVSGALFLHSNMTLKIDGILKGSTRAKDYPIFSTRFGGVEAPGYSGLVNVGRTIDHSHVGSLIRHVTICGSGTLNGGGSMLGSAEGGGDQRGALVYMANADQVNLQGLTLTNSAAWTIHPLYSSNITIHDLNIQTVGIHNGDGCDPDSSAHLYIFNDIFNTGDDCIAIKSGKNLEGVTIGVPSEAIRITDCTFNKGHGGVTIGSESSGGVKNVFVQDCTANGTNIGIRLKTAPERGGIVENITVKDMVMTGLSDFGISLIMNYKDNPGGPEAAPSLPSYRNLTFTNISIKSSRSVFIEGLTDSHAQNVLFQNCTFNSSSKLYCHCVDTLTFSGVTNPAGYDVGNCNGVKYQ